MKFTIYEKKETDNSIRYTIFGLSLKKKIKKNWFEILIKKASEQKQENILIYDSLADKYAEAADGLILFNYLQKRNIPSRYVILKENPAAETLKKLQNVIVLENQNVFLTELQNEIAKSRYIITSFGAGALANPLLTRLPFLEHIFIEHGVTYLKEWVSNAYNPKNFNRILCPTTKTLSLYRQNKVWPEHKIIKCGMLRWDNLKKTKNATKNIFLFFTWRISFLPEYKTDITKMQYFQKIDSLINSPELLRILDTHNLTLTIGSHHAMSNRGLSYTINNPRVNIADPDKISKYISEADMLITDYSSLCFDFMFQDKPVIFYKFDDNDNALCQTDKKNMAYAKTKDKEFYNCLYDEKEVINKIKYYAENNFVLEKANKNINDEIFFNRNNICKTFYETITGKITEQQHNFDNNRIPVILCTDNNYVPYVWTTIKSVIDNNHSENKYDFWILHENISAYKQKLLKSLENPLAEIHFFNIGEYINDNQLFYSCSYFSKSMYSRFFIPEIMKQYHKAIYLDCDMIVNCDLSELFNIDITNYAAGAVQDMSLYLTNNKRRDKLCNKLNFQNFDSYFNSGMLLLNISELNRTDFLKQCLMQLALNKNLDCPDQDILNLVLKNKVKILPSTYNHLYHLPWNGLYSYADNIHKEQYLNDHTAPKIIHYTSSQKPWNYPWNEFADEWWKHTKGSPFYEEIIYKNIKQSLPDKPFIEKQIKRLLKKNKIKSNIYKILSLLSFGKYKKHFRKKMEKYQ